MALVKGHLVASLEVLPWHSVHMVWSRARPLVLKFPKTFGSRQMRVGFSSELSPVPPPDGVEGKASPGSTAISGHKERESRLEVWDCCLRRLSRLCCGKSCLAFERTCSW